MPGNRRQGHRGRQRRHKGSSVPLHVHQQELGADTVTDFDSQQHRGIALEPTKPQNNGRRTALANNNSQRSNKPGKCSSSHRSQLKEGPARKHNLSVADREQQTDEVMPWDDHAKYISSQARTLLAKGSSHEEELKAPREASVRKAVEQSAKQRNRHALDLDERATTISGQPAALSIVSRSQQQSHPNASAKATRAAKEPGRDAFQRNRRRVRPPSAFTRQQSTSAKHGKSSKSAVSVLDLFANSPCNSPVASQKKRYATEARSVATQSAQAPASYRHEKSTLSRLRVANETIGVCKDAPQQKGLFNWMKTPNHSEETSSSPEQRGCPPTSSSRENMSHRGDRSSSPLPGDHDIDVEAGVLSDIFADMSLTTDGHSQECLTSSSLDDSVVFPIRRSSCSSRNDEAMVSTVSEKTTLEETPHREESAAPYNYEEEQKALLESLANLCTLSSDLLQRELATACARVEEKPTTKITKAIVHDSSFGSDDLCSAATNNLEGSIIGGAESCISKSTQSSPQSSQATSRTPSPLATSPVSSADATGIANIPPLEKLLQLCNQTAPVSFEEAFGGAAVCDNLVKVGEGSYAEVYALPTKRLPTEGVVFTGTNDHTAKQCSAMPLTKTMLPDGLAFKVMPIDGDYEINGDVPKRAQEVIAEVVCTQRLSDLTLGLTKAGAVAIHHGQNASSNNNPEDCLDLWWQAPGFIRAFKMSICEGETPETLLAPWDNYLQRKGSKCENDRPDVFDETQHHLVFAFENGGEDLESFTFASLHQAQFVLLHVVLSMAVAERALAFEHRDLHWGNVLVKRTKATHEEYVFNGSTIRVPTGGLMCNIIDFTLSRMQDDSTGRQSAREKENNAVVYFDVETDPEIFTGEGDIQFDVYREMREHVQRDWSKFEPKTNVAWIKYLTRVILDNKTYKSKAKREAQTRSELESFFSFVGTCQSVVEVVQKAPFVLSHCPDAANTFCDEVM